MTREEILKLEPGPELDRLIAERVMGWKNHEDFNFGPGGQIWRDKRVWSPSTDIATAWEVIETLREKKFVIDILGSLEDFIVKIWNENESEGLSIAKASAEQAPLAICRAALLAVMEAGNE